MTPHTSISLVEAARGGSEPARELLAADWLPIVLRWCIRIGGPRIDAQDAAQEVMIVVLTKLEKLRDPTCFGAWLYGVTRKVVGKQRRRAWVKRRSPHAVDEGLDSRRRPDRKARASQLAGEVERILSTLSIKQREVLVLCDVEQRSVPEAAQLMGIAVGTAASRLREARRHFKRAAAARALGTHLIATTGGWRQ